MPELNRPIRPDLGPFTPEEVRVRHSDPDELLLEQVCEFCTTEECPAAVFIGWTDLAERTSVLLMAGRGCVDPTVRTALSTGTTAHVSVTVPLWPGLAAAAAAEVPDPHDLIRWEEAGHLVRENGRIFGTAPLYAADQIDRARWLSRLTRRGMALHPAAQLLHYRDLAQQITETLPEIGALSHA